MYNTLVSYFPCAIIVYYHIICVRRLFFSGIEHHAQTGREYIYNIYNAISAADDATGFSCTVCSKSRLSVTVGNTPILHCNKCTIVFVILIIIIIYYCVCRKTLRSYRMHVCVVCTYYIIRMYIRNSVNRP